MPKYTKGVSCCFSKMENTMIEWMVVLGIFATRSDAIRTISEMYYAHLTQLYPFLNQSVGEIYHDIK